MIWPFPRNKREFDASQGDAIHEALKQSFGENPILDVSYNNHDDRLVIRLNMPQAFYDACDPKDKQPASAWLREHGDSAVNTVKETLTNGLGNHIEICRLHLGNRASNREPRNNRLPDEPYLLITTRNSLTSIELKKLAGYLEQFKAPPAVEPPVAPPPAPPPPPVTSARFSALDVAASRVPRQSPAPRTPLTDPLAMLSRHITHASREGLDNVGRIRAFEGIAEEDEHTALLSVVETVPEHQPAVKALLTEHHTALHHCDFLSIVVKAGHTEQAYEQLEKALERQGIEAALYTQELEADDKLIAGGSHVITAVCVRPERDASLERDEDEITPFQMLYETLQHHFEESIGVQRT